MRGLGSLTRREVQILEGLSAGLDNKDIGSRLGITARTVKSIIRNVAYKTGVGAGADRSIYNPSSLRIPLAVMWSQYKMKHKDCELFHIGLTEFGVVNP